MKRVEFALRLLPALQQLSFVRADLVQVVAKRLPDRDLLRGHVFGDVSSLVLGRRPCLGRKPGSGGGPA